MISTDAAPHTRMPAVPNRPFFGTVSALQKDMLGFLGDAWRNHGDSVRIPFGFGNLFMFVHPDQAYEILVEKSKNFRKNIAYQRLGAVLGNGLVNSEGEFWRRQRRLMQPAFHKRQIAALGEQISQSIGAMLARWEQLCPAAGDTAEIDLHAEMMSLTLKIVAQALFRADVSADTRTVAEAVAVTQEHVDRQMSELLPLPNFIPTPRNLRFQRAKQSLDEIVYRMIENRRKAGGEEQADLLSMLIHARDEETGDQMTNRQLRDEVMTLFLAGHETTAATLTWTWLLLTQSPAIQRRLAEEAGNVLADSLPANEHLPALTYTRQVLDESMRLYPPGWSVGRENIQTETIGGYRLPPGSQVIIPVVFVHRHPEFWPNPEGFDPDRFAPGKQEGRHKLAYMPFGAGPRMCIGNQFALVEATMALAAIASRFHLELVSGQDLRPVAMVTMRPGHGLWVRIRRK